MVKYNANFIKKKQTNKQTKDLDRIQVSCMWILELIKGNMSNTLPKASFILTINHLALCVSACSTQELN